MAQVSYYYVENYNYPRHAQKVTFKVSMKENRTILAFYRYYYNKELYTSIIRVKSKPREKP